MGCQCGPPSQPGIWLSVVQIRQGRPREEQGLAPAHLGRCSSTPALPRPTAGLVASSLSLPGSHVAPSLPFLASPPQPRIPGLRCLSHLAESPQEHFSFLRAVCEGQRLFSVSYLPLGGGSPGEAKAGGEGGSGQILAPHLWERLGARLQPPPADHPPPRFLLIQQLLTDQAQGGSPASNVGLLVIWARV